jgi:4-methyl-5(b-hydroxyethyl)-thiazole monophosphate biosynthesis
MVHLFLAAGFEEIEALMTVDILRRARIEVNMVSISGSRTVVGAHGIAVKADAIYKKSIWEESDCLIFPGGMPGADNLRKHDGVRNAVQQMNAKGGYIAAICASPALVLGTSGVLNSRKATTYPGTGKVEDEAIYLEDNLVVDENIITAKAPAFTSDFAFKIVEALKGIDAVNDVKRAMCLI